MTDPSPTLFEDERVFPHNVRDGALSETELAAAVRAHPTPSRPTGTGPVRWIRAADAVAELSSTTAGRGIDLHGELARRLRSTVTALQPSVADRIRSVPEAVRAVLPSRASGAFERSR